MSKNDNPLHWALLVSQVDERKEFNKRQVLENLPLVKFWQSVEIDAHPPCALA